MMKSAFASLYQFFFRLRHGITVSNASFEVFADEVCEQESSIATLSDSDLRQEGTNIAHGSSRTGSERILAKRGFAVIREAAWRTLKLKPFHVQLQAALALVEGKCIEMGTGEGKTLAAAAAACWLGLSGRSVHILTFNDYLAQRDAEWMKPLFEFFGLSVGAVLQSSTLTSRRLAYRSNVTYVTAREAGFDFLRDQLAECEQEQVQCDHDFAIVDEADSTLIDEARIPLVIATAESVDEHDLLSFAQIVRGLRRGAHFEVRSEGRNVTFTDSGLHQLEAKMGISELYSESHMETLARLNLALQAHVLLHRDVDYIVRDGLVELIDEFTGRVAENRKWPGGLQAALEAKESVAVQPQGRILNSITLQHFVELHRDVAGMTGTAVEASEELDEFYKLKVVVIPPNQQCRRIDYPYRVFATREEKYTSLCSYIRQQHRQQRPILVGTSSVDESNRLSQRLQDIGVSSNVLNAANDEQEAAIVSESGSPGAVTISTNMAGRGTDIRLGGSDGAYRTDVVDVGGLLVIGTNRHESRRIDNQLRGRSGRQGDPGGSIYFVSLEDDLISRHHVEEFFQAEDFESTECPDSARTIAHVQRIIEGQSFEIRRTMRMYSYLLEVQRRVISEYRSDLVHGRRTPNAFRKACPDKRQQLVETWGIDLIERSERKATLRHLDWCWSDHLARANELRENIYLVSLGGFNAFDAYNREMNVEFQAFIADVERRAVETLSTGTYSDRGLDLEASGLKAPTSTWTFMINDNPRGAVLSQLLKGLVSRIRNALGSGRN